MVKLAICFHGVSGKMKQPGIDNKLREWKIPYKRLVENIIKDNEVDIFFHSWETDEKEEIINSYNPKRYMFELQQRDPSHPQRLLSLKKSIDLLKEYIEETNTKYDFILSTRFDACFEKEIDFTGLDNNNIYTSHWCRILDSNFVNIENFALWQNPELQKNGHFHVDQKRKLNDNSPIQNGIEIGILDMYMLSNFENIYTYSRMYDKISQYRNQYSLILHPHKGIKYHFEQTGLDDKIEYLLCYVPDVPIARRKYLKADH